MTDVAKHYFSPISSVYHYLHMANGNYLQYLQADTVKIKKYFYVLRPIMACMWIEARRRAQTAPDMKDTPKPRNPRQNPAIALQRGVFSYPLLERDY
jgi:predicted nucleotidyltransferase